MDRFIPYTYETKNRQLILNFFSYLVFWGFWGAFIFLVSKKFFSQASSIFVVGGIISVVLILAVSSTLFGKFRLVQISREEIIYIGLLGKPISISFNEITEVRRLRGYIILRDSEKKIAFPLSQLPEHKRTIILNLLIRLIPHEALPPPIQRNMEVLNLFKEQIKTNVESITVSTQKRSLVIKRAISVCGGLALTGLLTFSANNIGSQSYPGFTIMMGLILIGIIALWRNLASRSISINQEQIVHINGKKSQNFNWKTIETVVITTFFFRIWINDHSFRVPFRNMKGEDVEKMVDILQKQSILHDVPIGR